MAKTRLATKPSQKQEHSSDKPFGDIPKGQLQIFISINQEKLHLYSDGKEIAEALVATGLPGHATPMGAFSILSKDRYHHSNIYSNAPMPFMQRITWSGVAMHEGVGVGHPASHGCIRMPHEFAARLWVITKLGIRVIIEREELKPVGFADPHLFVRKDTKSSTAAALPPPVQTAQSIDTAKATDAETPRSIAIAANDPPPAAQAATVADPPGDSVDPPAKADDPPVVKDADDPPAAANDAAASGPAKAESDGAAASEPANPAAPAAAAAPAEAVAPAAPAAAASAPPETAQPALAAQPASPELRGSDDTTATIVAPEEDFPLPPPKPASAMQSAAENHAQIAVFVSRKTKRIYVRQHFTPLFDAPVTIADPDKPLGTHVFTAMGVLDDGTTLRWNVVTLPSDAPKSRGGEPMRRIDRLVKGRYREQPQLVAEKPVATAPSTPEAALARIDMPPLVRDLIGELIVPGSSLVVSDQGLGEETGEDTDFIVLTH